MKYINKLIFLMFLLSIPSFATTYYVCTATGAPCNAADSNTGTSKSATWLHAPGMSTATGLASSTVINAGDQIIFRGGDTWHESSGSPQIGTWTFTRSGSNGSPIYIGVDLTFFAGGSFARPIISGDNTVTTSQPATCSFTDDSVVYLTINASWVTFDNFEFTGDCQTTQSFVEFIQLNSAGNRIISNLYIHGWTLATTTTDDRRFLLNSADSSSPPTDIATGNVFDGSDSSLGNVCTVSSCVASCWNGSGAPTTPCATGWAMAGNWANVNKNVFRHVSNGMEINDVRVIHDNLFEYIFEPIFSSRHGNVVETLSNSTSSFVAYNNITRNVNEGENWNPASPVITLYNNVWENDQHFPPDPNCILLEPNASNTSAIISVTYYQNTTDSTCVLSAHSSTWASGSSSTYQNNHIIGFTSINNWVACNGQSGCSSSQTDNGGETFMTTGAATTQGYVLSNDFSPTLSNNSTVHNGNNLTSTCGTGSFTSDLCSGTTKGCVESSGSGGQISSCPAITVNARGSTWDSGAYQFTAGGGGGTVSTPTFSPVAGPYIGTQTVAITSATDGATICYTIDNSTPTGNGAGTCTHGTTLANGGTISVSVNETVKAIGTLSGSTDSAVGSAAYTITAGPTSSVLLTSGAIINLGTVIK